MEEEEAPAAPQFAVEMKKVTVVTLQKKERVQERAGTTTAVSTVVEEHIEKEEAEQVTEEEKEEAEQVREEEKEEAEQVREEKKEEAEQEREEKKEEAEQVREEEKEEAEQVTEEEKEEIRAEMNRRAENGGEVSSDIRPPLPDPTFNRRCSLLASDVKYKEDLEKMRGQSLFVPGAELIHSKNISAFISESKYKEEGKKEATMSLYSILPETPETQHAREASELQSEVKYKGNVKTELCSSLYCLLPQTTETQFVKELTEILSEVRMDQRHRLLKL